MLVGQRGCDGRGGRSQVDVRALDVDDIPLVADFGIHAALVHPLQTCCPSPSPYPSRSMVFKFDSETLQRKEIWHGGGECCQRQSNKADKENIRNKVEESQICTHQVPNECMHVGHVSSHCSTLCHLNTKVAP